jgi:hypothetical protein
MIELVEEEFTAKPKQKKAPAKQTVKTVEPPAPAEEVTVEETPAEEALVEEK